MKTHRAAVEVRDFRHTLDGTVGFVPTMGALHDGHLFLVEESRRACEHTLVSIYVNPTQFNNPNDLTNYPDTLDNDLEVLKNAGVAAVFLPTYEVLYPDDFAYEVDEKVFSRELCGAHRAGHFTGVLTVVMKLLNLIRPDQAYFGEKDYQQLKLVRGMAEAFFLQTEIVGCPTMREPDGLAMSSRNLNLSRGDRQLAPVFNELLQCEDDDEEVVARLAESGFTVDYVRTIEGRRFGAVLMGNEDSPVRLIDNVSIG
ncbi:MAG: pantoate--beta-alanine ligase [Gammaproteobacteria bacterium]|nr:pantoate--beta-alanine ligase [Gammaproteobacteria bacterium]MBT4491694.1 pantoate--beta-alanine ligase [Gammaproteobacteria bacterium]MBT7369068.1 pantoate--beta-alanine ligase [Gammaproteobacteria bacterium]